MPFFHRFLFMDAELLYNNYGIIII